MWTPWTFEPLSTKSRNHSLDIWTFSKSLLTYHPFMRFCEKSVMEQYLFTLGGKIRCVRCNAMSKRTNSQCSAPAIKGKTKCRTHGGKSTGPKTTDGKARCAQANTVHGWETRQGRVARGEAMKRLRQLEELGHFLGFISGQKMPGRKPA